MLTIESSSQEVINNIKNHYQFLRQELKETDSINMALINTYEEQFIELIKDYSESVQIKENTYEIMFQMYRLLVKLGNQDNMPDWFYEEIANINTRVPEMLNV